MRTCKARIEVFVLFIIFSSCKANSSDCHEKEKQALLSFKHALIDPTNRLSSWSVHEDCCGWTGVRCDGASGRVVGIHLGNWNDNEVTGPHGILGGEISPDLLDLQFLNHLDLSYNDFEGNSIPTFLGSMQSLSVLLLFDASFGGIIPPQLSNLSGLHYLALGCFDALSCELYFDNFSWISGLSSLETLVLEGIDLHKDVHWLEYVSVLPSLSWLYMAQCQLDNMSPSLDYVNFTSLLELYLPLNNFNHELPIWLFNLSSNLMILDLHANSLRGQIPTTISNLHSLISLKLSGNQLTGQIPESLGQLNHLVGLHLYFNSLDGLIPSSIGNLSSLSSLFLQRNLLNGALPESMAFLQNMVHLVIAGNPLSGIVSDLHFTKLSNLKTLIMSWTNLTLSVSSYWIPPFQLRRLESCKMGPRFPSWLQTQRNLLILKLSNSGIEDAAPRWFWKWAAQIHLILDLSDNLISGDLSNVLLNNTVVDLSSNRFIGHLPRLSQNVLELRIAGNSFSRQISSFMCRKGNGRSKLQVLNLSNNSLYGKLASHCLRYWQSLTHLDITDNNLFGKIPNSIGSLSALQTLHLSNNSFSGDIPASLLNCTFLGILDLAENELSGNIPSWIGKISNLSVLSLRSNKLTGNVPPQICQLSSLIIFDLANNSLSGGIPKCISNFSTMARIDTASDNDQNTVFTIDDFNKEDLSLVDKGRKWEYDSILAQARTIDFSSNNLCGSIPDEISSLSGLRFLNLSRNHLRGKIPEKVGGITSLESLDLSRNYLSGAIPESITNLSFLADLDLSYNNLSGRIPSSTQLLSFDALRFIGNAGLCGPPLTVNCTTNEDFEGANHCEENREEFEMTWFYIGMASGFALSWGVLGVLILKREWRHAYFRFIDGTVATLLKMKRLRGHLRGHQRGPKRF